MSLFVGLDCGTQSTKCLVYNESKRAIVGRGSAPHTVIQERPGQAEQHPSMWIDACKTALTTALQNCDKSQVKAIAVSGQQHGLVALDAQKQVIRPSKLWCDVESADEAEALSRQFGTTLVPSFTITKVLWLKNKEPENYERLSHILLPHDYINLYFTGKLVMEASDASGTGVFDTKLQTWDLDRINAIDPKLATCFPSLIGPNEPVGMIVPTLAAELGLPESVVIAPGGGDNAMSALGAGAVEEGTWVVSLGTSGTLFGASNTPVLDPTGAICPFCDATGKWLPLLCTLNCTGVVEEIRQSFGMDHSQLTELALKEPPGSEGLNFLPYLNGERTPNWPHASGAVIGLRPGLLRPGLLYRAAMEGATFSLVAGLRKLQGYDLKAAQLLVVGGGSKNPLWRRILADAFQLPLRFPAEPESAALGAALQAGAIFKKVPIEEFLLDHKPPMEEESVMPSAEVAGAYKTAFQRYQNWGNNMFGGGKCDI